MSWWWTSREWSVPEASMANRLPAVLRAGDSDAGLLAGLLWPPVVADSPPAARRTAQLRLALGTGRWALRACWPGWSCWRPDASPLATGARSASRGSSHRPRRGGQEPCRPSFDGSMAGYFSWSPVPSVTSAGAGVAGARVSPPAAPQLAVSVLLRTSPFLSFPAKSLRLRAEKTRPASLRGRPPTG